MIIVLDEAPTVSVTGAKVINFPAPTKPVVTPEVSTLVPVVTIAVCG